MVSVVHVLQLYLACCYSDIFVNILALHNDENIGNHMINIIIYTFASDQIICYVLLLHHLYLQMLRKITPGTKMLL